MPVRVANQSEPIPGYKLIERLGRGGFGEVWKAEAPGGLLKAIKFVYGEIEGKAGAEGKGGAVAADQELKALNRVKTVRHPYLLSLERVDIIDGQLIIVMELADRNLLDRFKECQSQGLPGIPREELLRYMEESAEALDLMNVDFQLQHLDIKPQNLFLVRNHIKVADFGLCKDLDDFRATVTGGVTPLYAAPETFEGWVSRYCDQYSLAIVYQELLTGQRPFDGTNARQLLMQHVQMPPDLAPLPENDRPVIGRALSKKPPERFDNCQEMVRALRAAGGEPVQRSSQPLSAPSTPQRQDTPEDPDAAADDIFRSNASKSAEAITRNILPAGPRPAREEIKKTRMSFHGIAKTPKPAAGPEAGASAEMDTSQRPIQLSAPIEFRGEGVLLPALVIGLGRLGQAVIGNLRQALCDRFGSLEHLPHLRLLYMDTDAEAVQASVHGGQAASLDPGDVLLTRLHRPSHYLNPRAVSTEGGQPLIATWLDPQMLYRIPRNQSTGSVRALGRLALLDNYPEVNERMLEELRTCTEAEALSVADRHTKLGLRVNRPRVYVIAGLGGGTGSGMFIDVAYAARHQLKRLGYEQPEVVGLLFLPTVDKQKAKPMALGNAFAALRELHHFGSPGVIYTVRHAAKQPPLTDAAPPFARCTLLPAESEDDVPRDMAGVAAGFLFRDLMSPLGRLADDRRAASRKDTLELKPGVKTPPICHTFGMFRLSWPRRLLVERSARRVGLRLVQHWISKDAAGLRGEVEQWVKDQWSKRQLQADHLIACLRAGAEGALDVEPEEAFTALLEPLEKDKASWAATPDPARARHILAEAEKLVGRPDGVASPQPPLLKEGLENAARSLLANCEQKVAEMAVHLVEQPKFRFAGADEAINQMEQVIRLTIEQQEQLAKDFSSKASEAYQRITATLEAVRAALTSKRKLPPGVAEVPDLLRVYPMLRFKGMMLQHVLTVYRSLLGNCPEYMREFTYCRTRLTDLLKTFEKPPPSASSPDLGAVRQLLPGGCRSFDDAVNRLVDSIDKQELLEIDKKVQAAIQRQLKAMVHVCTTPAPSILREVEFLLTTELEGYIRARLGATNLLDTFFEQFPRNEAVTTQMANVYEEALPNLEVRGLAAKEHIALVTVPADPAVERFRDLAQEALADAELITVAAGDDIIFYRDATNLKFTDLPQLGPEGKAAYDRMCAAEHFTAHNRIDVTDWRPLTAH
jgi:eukaryotic-like serine/threonine-protein kinase